MLPENKTTLTGYKGRTFQKLVYLKDDDGVAIATTGYTVSFSVYKNGVLQLTNTCSVVSELLGKVLISCSPTETANLLGLYSYEVAMTASGVIIPYALGTMTFIDPTGTPYGGIRDWIANNSPYVVSDEMDSEFTSAQYESNLAQATELLTKQDPGLPTNLR